LWNSKGRATRPKLQSNYNSIEIITAQSLDQVFSRFLQTYDGIKRPNNTVVTVTAGTPVTGPGQSITFEMLGKIGLLGSLPLANCGDSGTIVSCPVQGPFSVQTERFDSAAHTISAVTLQGHPIAGWRYWRVFSAGTTNDIVVETGAVDTHAPGPVNWAGYYALQGVQIESWRQYMQYILTTLKTIDPSAHQGSTPKYNLVNGEWNQSPSQAYILNNVCQASSCN
jgi:hypothetical protein